MLSSRLGLDLALEEEEALLERVVVLVDEAARRVLHDHQVELAGAGVRADDDLQRRPADVRAAEARQADRLARRRQRGDVEVVAAVGRLDGHRGSHAVDEGGVLERGARLGRADLEPAAELAGFVDERVRDSAVDEDVVVDRELFARAGDLERQPSVEDVEGLLERVQVLGDAAAGDELGDDDLLVRRATGPADQRPPGVALAVPGVGTGVSGGLRDPAEVVHASLLSGVQRR